MNKTTQLTNDINRLHYVLDLIDLDNPSGTTLTDAMRVELNNIEKQLTRYYNYPSLMTESLTLYNKNKFAEVVRLSQSITEALEGTTIDTETLTRTTHYICGELNQVKIKTPKNQVA